jgi:hypothetical protein
VDIVGEALVLGFQVCHVVIHVAEGEGGEVVEEEEGRSMAEGAVSVVTRSFLVLIRCRSCEKQIRMILFWI